MPRTSRGCLEAWKHKIISWIKLIKCVYYITSWSWACEWGTDHSPKIKCEKERRSFELHPIYLTKCPVLWNANVSCQGNPAVTHVGKAVPPGGVKCGNLKDESWPMTTILKVCALRGGCSQYHHVSHTSHNNKHENETDDMRWLWQQWKDRRSRAENSDDNDNIANNIKRPQI